MDSLIHWFGLLSVIEPHYPKPGRRGRQPMPLETMLRIYFLQQWYALSDPAMEDALLEIESMRRFAHLDLMDDALPDETTILNFRHLLEKHGLTQQMLQLINELLQARGCLLKGGTMVDATSSTRALRQRTGTGSVTPKCTKPARASNGISG